MASLINKQDDGTIKLTIDIPFNQIAKTRETVLEDYVKQADVPGFRKGKAPKKLVEEKIDEDKIKEEVLRKLLPQNYIEAVREHNLNPIINPHIHVGKMPDYKEKKDWQFTAETCEAPEVNLNSYKDNVRKATAKAKIIVPGKEQQEVSFDDIVKAVLESVQISIPQIIINNEVDRLLAQTLDEVKKLGLTLDQYLGSTKRTAEDLKKEYEQKAQNDIKLEFALQKIAQTENITVEEKEIDEAINQTKSETERQNLSANRYLLASILRQQKTLDFLKNL